MAPRRVSGQPSCCKRGRKKFLVANGQEMGHYGRKKIKFGGETGSVKTMSFEVTDVTKPLVEVRRIMEKKATRSTSGRSATSGTSTVEKGFQ